MPALGAARTRSICPLPWGSCRSPAAGRGGGSGRRGGSPRGPPSAAATRAAAGKERRLLGGGGRGGPSERRGAARRGGVGAGGVEGSAAGARSGAEGSVPCAVRLLAARSLAQHAGALPPPLPLPAGRRVGGALRGQQELPRPHRGPLPLRCRESQGARPPGAPHQSGLQRRRLGGNFAACRAAQPHRVPVSTALSTPRGSAPEEGARGSGEPARILGDRGGPRGAAVPECCCRSRESRSQRIII